MAVYAYIVAKRRNGAIYIGMTDEWRRRWTLMLTERDNPTWADLYETLNA